jgi:hypothetical protein
LSATDNPETRGRLGLRGVVVTGAVTAWMALIPMARGADDPWMEAGKLVGSDSCGRALETLKSGAGSLDDAPPARRLFLLTTLIRAGEGPTAEALARRWTDETPDSGDTRALLALAQWSNGHIGQAAESLEGVSEPERSNPIARLVSAWVLKARGNGHSAEEAIQGALDAADTSYDPIRFEWYKTRGQVSLDLGNTDEASTSLETALQTGRKSKATLALATILRANRGERFYQVEDERASTRVPMKVRGGGYPFIKVSIDHHAPAWFLVDTGAPGVYLTPSFAREIGAVPAGPVIEGTSAGGDLGFKPILLDDVKIGDVTIRNVPAGLGAKDFKVKFLGLTVFKLNGVIGTQLLRNFSVTMDFGRHEFSLAPPGGVRPGLDGAVLMLVLDEKIVVPSTIDGAGPFLLYLDTGAGTTLDLKSRALPRLQPENPRREVESVKGLSGETRSVPGLRFVAKDLRLGPYMRTAVPAWVELPEQPTSDAPEKRCGSLDPPLDGMVGHRLLGDRKVLLDFESAHLWVLPSGEERSASKPDH